MVFRTFVFRIAHPKFEVTLTVKWLSIIDATSMTLINTNLISLALTWRVGASYQHVTTAVPVREPLLRGWQLIHDHAGLEMTKTGSLTCHKICCHSQR